ncbi:MAG: porin [Leptolyngbya sp.]|nr:MAG: porin [Leptolyngbya sp.]
MVSIQLFYKAKAKLPALVWSALFASGAVGLISSSAIASEDQTAQSAVSPTLIADATTASSKIDQVISTSNSLEGGDPTSETEQDQVTSVSQLTDVRPTDWAFQALQSLVERYGCIVGYPDKTFRGNRALTRFEFAAGLNACLDKIQELIAAATADFVKKEDLEVVKKLQEEFAAELAALRGRVESLEVRTATLEKQQFSTTTKLSGNVWFNYTGATTFDKNIRYEGRPGDPAEGRFVGVRGANGAPTVLTTDKAQPTASFLTWLNFNTSFTGRDSLLVQLAAGNGISPANQFASAGFFNSFGTPFTDQTGGPNNGNAEVVIHDLFYTFPLSDKITVTVGPRVNWYRYFDFNRYTFFITGASSFDSIGNTLSNAIDRGSGAVIEWNISPKFRFAAAYLGENTEFLPARFGFNTSSNPQFGLFGGTNTSTAELTFSPTRAINIRALYTYTRQIAYGNGQVGGATGEPIPYGYLDAGPGFSTINPVTGAINGGLKSATSHHLGVSADWSITPNFGVFGRYGLGWTTLQPIDKLVRTQAFQAGLGFPDILKKGSLGVITFLMPMDIQQGRRFFAAGGGDGGTMYELEASYYYPITDNISLVPAFYAIFNANNFNSNPNIYVFNLRTQFSF